MQYLETNIESLQDKISRSIRDINEGGCIHFAYYFSKRLAELKIFHKILFVDIDPIDLTYNGFVPVNHVLVWIPEIGYVDGVVTHSSLESVIGFNHYRHLKPGLTKLDNFRKNCK